MIARLMKNKTPLHVLLPITLHAVDRVVEVPDRRCRRRGSELSHREGLRVHHDSECDAVRRHVYSDGCPSFVDLPPHEVHIPPPGCRLPVSPGIGDYDNLGREEGCE